MIRPATPQDAPQIAAIWNHAIRETTITFNPVEKSAAEVAELTARACLVWEEAGRVLGFARYFQFRGGEGYRYTVEHTIMLHADGHGQGGGRQLMTALCADAKAAGMHTMFAGCSAENPGAVAFHARMGFQEVARLPEVGFKFGRWIDLVLMQKTL
ncbi:MAG: GNAT family N-acetyltransferase [Yoonia sp.]|uniref:GNAT family N-acetyltransferase n=1 Tax=Yoonia sp. TaxID=2212373 RepID=UPI00273E9655|nr:GNAT family N-acetyltransferase [Yoonia sp.]MDP5084726.1 GNAT family N-acetyltransferase [Yoonia sp.]MDP5361526.1 GNAT family N-acetyltransferase [Paracoccaceae bacterium]